MRQWKEHEFLSCNRWYHATSKKFFDKIIHDGIKADINRHSELDFGYGFYLAENSDWAEKYAKGFDDGRIIEFHFRPVDILGEDKNYRFFGKLDEEFAEFVFLNRMYFSDNADDCVHSYDLVAGVMSDGTQATDFEEFRDGDISKSELFGRLLLPKEDWQISIHSQLLCDQIIPCRAYDLKGGEYDVSKYHKAV